MDFDENDDVDTETERSKNWISPVLVSFVSFKRIQITNMINRKFLEL